MHLSSTGFDIKIWFQDSRSALPWLPWQDQTLFLALLGTLESPIPRFSRIETRERWRAGPLFFFTPYQASFPHISWKQCRVPPVISGRATRWGQVTRTPKKFVNLQWQQFFSDQFETSGIIGPSMLQDIGISRMLKYDDLIIYETEDLSEVVFC